MTYSTSEPSVDIKSRVSGIENWAKTATRLHPRPGHPSIARSHVGGPVLWPVDEQVPRCTEAHWEEVRHQLPEEQASRFASLMHAVTERREAGASVFMSDAEKALFTETMADWESVGGEFAYKRVPVEPGNGHRMVPVGQFFAREFPDVPFPAGSDLLQILWCPEEHHVERVGVDPYWGPEIQIRWRSARTLEQGRALTLEAGEMEGSEIVITPCVLEPERVVEYPFAEELPKAISDQISALGDDFEAQYQYELSIARGWKLGGWAAWHKSGFHPFVCSDCGCEMTLLLKMDTREWDGGSDRWRPLEDRGLQSMELFRACEPTGIDAAWGELRVFVCSRDARHQIAMGTQ